MKKNLYTVTAHTANRVVKYDFTLKSSETYLVFAKNESEAQKKAYRYCVVTKRNLGYIIENIALGKAHSLDEKIAHAKRVGGAWL